VRAFRIINHVISGSSAR